MKGLKGIKCVMVGDGEVGKTSLLISYTSGIFQRTYIPTIYDTVSMCVMVENITVNLTLWDTAGQEDFERLRLLAYPETNVFIICFSLVNRTSFLNVKSKWRNELRMFSRETPIILVGTKLDLRNVMEEQLEWETLKSNDEFVSEKEGYLLSKEIKAHTYIECSALTQVGVKQVYDEAIKAAFGIKHSVTCHCSLS